MRNNQYEFVRFHVTDCRKKQMHCWQILTAVAILLVPTLQAQEMASQAESQTVSPTTLQIDGPYEVWAGDLVVLKAAFQSVDIIDHATLDSVATTMATQPQQNCTFVWQVIPPTLDRNGFFVCDQGQTLVFASRVPGDYHFVLAASDGTQLQMLTHTVSNMSNENIPLPIPPQPEPPKPPDFEKALKVLRDWYKNDTVKLVQSAYFEREKNAVAASFNEVLKKIEQNEIKTLERARTELRASTRRNLSGISRQSISAWAVWESELARQLESLEQEGKLKTLAELQQVIKIIGKGD